MKILRFMPLLAAASLMQCTQPAAYTGFADVSTVQTGTPVSVMLTAYSTTLPAGGKAQTRLRIALTDSAGREITSASEPVQLYVEGDGKVSAASGKILAEKTDSTRKKYTECRLEKGICNLVFTAGTKPGKVKVEARSGKCWPGSHEIHTLPAGFVRMKPTPEQLNAKIRAVGNIMGADISWLPQLEDEGTVFKENGIPIDAIQLLKNHGFNYIRLRIFVNPENAKGYSPGKGYCGLPQTLAMAKRVKSAGLKLLLDFHYSDYWADPQQQYMPASWQKLDFSTLKDSVKTYTSRVLIALQRQGTLPDMVQVGNEINHGLLWPAGHISQPDQLAALLQAGVNGVRVVAPGMPVMMHIALGGQNEEAVFWLDNMIARGVQFDVIGLSYYPRWHGTLADLQANIRDLAKRYRKPLNVVEYSDYKTQVHDIAYSVPGGLGTGACIWEPLNMRSGLFDKDNNATPLWKVYDELSRKYLLTK